jgi:hypothetical protein
MRATGTPTGGGAMVEASAVVHLRGHGTRPARLDVIRYSPVAWLTRVLRYAFGWLGATFATLVITFDPFVASFPFVIGLGYLYRTIRGRYAVRHFEGECPRCSTPLTLKPGAKIPLPLDLVCYACHHEPELRLVEG